jgi:hypothetical protein
MKNKTKKLDTSDTEYETQDGIDENEVYEILPNKDKDKQFLDDKSVDQFEVISKYYEDEIRIWCYLLIQFNNHES